MWQGVDVTQEEFFLANAVNGVLSPEQAMQMLSLPEVGDTTKVESSVPSVAPVPEVKVDEPKAAPESVILAKDGVHTIPFEKLVEARDGERHWKDVAAAQQAELDALKASPTAGTEVERPTLQPVAADFGDFSEEAIAKGIDALVNAKVSAALAPIQQQKELSETEQHFNAINAKHPDVESVIPSQEFATWVAKQPSFVQQTMKAVVEQGTAAQVIELLDTYKAGKPGSVPASDMTDAARAKAAAVIAKAQSAPPTSLSEIPGGTSAHHDEVAAMLEMSSAGLMSKFDGKSPEQIAALMNRLV